MARQGRLPTPLPMLAMTCRPLGLRVAICSGLLSAAALAQQPNFVFIMADDLGWTALSAPQVCLGYVSDFHETPTLERLANEGMSFPHAYTNGANCAPTRAALLTGQYAARPTNNVFAVNSLNRGGSGTLLRGPSQGLSNGQDEIPGAAITIAEVLGSAGYATAHVGKFHSGGSMANNTVLAQGFDVNFGGGSAGSPSSYRANNNSGSWQFAGGVGPELDVYALPYDTAYVNSAIVPFNHGANTSLALFQEKQVTDAVADATIDFIDANKDVPFYVQMHQYAVHGPIGNVHAREDLLAKYQAKTPGQIHSNDPYGAMIEQLDQSIDRVIDYLESTPDPRNAGLPLAQNTIVVFFSDNGGPFSFTTNTPLTGNKGEYSEGGIRVPMIAWSANPALVEPNAVNNTPVIGTDFLPTFAALAGANTAALTLDGESLAPILADHQASLARQSIFWHFPGYLVDGSRSQRPQSLVRQHHWKLFYNYEDASWELYDVVADISETNNLAECEPGVVQSLGAELRQWLLATAAPLPTFRNATNYVDGASYPAGASVPLPILPTGTSCPPVDWQDLAPAAAPGARNRHVVVHDGVHTLVFGGNSGSGFEYNDLWRFDGVGWSPANALLRPTGRRAAAATFDTARLRTVLFGGRDGSNNYLGDTWEWSGANWVQAASGGPQARDRHALAFDPVRGTSLLFGGRSGGSLGDTWTYGAGGWTQLLPPASPAAREDHGMSFHAALGQVVLFGGESNGGSLLSDTWAFDGANWTQIATASRPSARRAFAITYDPTREVVVLFGGQGNGGRLADTWEFDGSNWRERATVGTPPARNGAAMAFDGNLQRAVLFGGFDGGGDQLADTWSYGPNDPATFATRELGCPGPLGVPQLAADLPPWTGTNFEVRIEQMHPLHFPLLVLGTSSTDWLGTPLPLSLGLLGAPQCLLRVNAETTLLLSNVGGSAAHVVPIPNDPLLAGLPFFVQGIVFDIALQISATGRGDVVVGVR